MSDRILLVMAMHDGELIGGALNFIGTDTIYGRNWGATTYIQNLHFEPVIIRQSILPLRINCAL